MARTLPIVGAVATLSLASCGGSESGQAAQLDADQQALADALAEDLESGELSLEPGESRCLADQIVTRVGVERLAEMGVTVQTPEQLGSSSADLTAGDADAVADSFAACLDLRENFSRDLAAGGADNDQQACVLDKIDTADLRDMFAANLRGDYATAGDETPIDIALRECGLGG